MDSFGKISSECKKLQKRLKDIERLHKLKASGQALERNQQAKLASRDADAASLKKLEDQRRKLLLSASSSKRESLGACGNCGSTGHTTPNCPRPKVHSATNEDKGRKGGKGKGKGKGKGDKSGKGKSKGDKGGKGKAKSEFGKGKAKGKGATGPALHPYFAVAKAEAEVPTVRQLRNAKNAGKCANCGSTNHVVDNCPRPLPPLLAQQVSELRRHLAKPKPVREFERREQGVYLESDLSAATHAVRKAHSESVGSVLVIAEKPSVAKAIANILSGGKKRTRNNTNGNAPMCALHDFFAYFPPAKGKCRVTVTSVIGRCSTRISATLANTMLAGARLPKSVLTEHALLATGHMYGLDFDEMTGSDPVGLYGAHTRKVSALVKICSLRYVR
jgi:hypothetical protein